MGKVALPDGRILARAVSASFCEIQNLLNPGTQERGRRCLRVPNRAECAKDVVDLDLVNRKIAKHRHDVLGERAFEINRPLLTAPAGAVGSNEFRRDLPETYARTLSSPRTCRHLAPQKLRPQRTRLLARVLEAHRVQRTKPKLGALAGTVELEDPGPAAARHHLEIKPTPV